MTDFTLWVIAGICGVIGLPMLILALIEEFSGQRTYKPRAKYQRGK